MKRKRKGRDMKRKPGGKKKCKRKRKEEKERWIDKEG